VIVVAGEALVDLVDEDGASHAVAGGGPFNTAVALGRLEVPVAFLGSISRDAYGEMLVQLLVDARVDTSLVRRSDAPTARADVHRGNDGRNAYTFHLDGTSLADLEPDELPPLANGAWAVHAGTLSLALDPPASAYEALVQREAGARCIILDPNVRPEIFGDRDTYRRRFERLARLADLIKLSEDDAAWIYPEGDARSVLESLLALGPRLVALTRGRRGAMVASHEAVVDVPGIEVEVVDTVGAGDSFGAALLAALVDEDTFGPKPTQPLAAGVLARAATYAIAASALTCTRTGAMPPTRDEIESLLPTGRARPRRSAVGPDPSG
jgi:fructokinase